MPFDVPDAPLVTVNQLALLVAVHVQPVPETTLTLPVAEPLLTVADELASEYVHPPPVVAWRKFATVLAVLFRARALFCEEVPVTFPP